ncbi:MAG TPA: adenylate/guanylate cyclase domain-containing protein [Nitrosopumilus sp.]|nr:adenylate/guanylate cyclase domain-containing protein [Thermoproteota archaeon]HJJ22782.1 adenylate/guanylate cyclase domain-containing protein [Nitrosopumilus sp.]
MKNYVSKNSFLTINGDNKEYPQYSVTISDQQQNYCVGLVDMIGSTDIAAKLGHAQIGTYYEIFLNSMSKVLARFGGKIIKNIGDCLLFFFPESTHQNRKFGVMSCLECVLAMTEEHDEIKKKLRDAGLPSMNYRISVDYGNVFVMKSNYSSIDLIGTPVNICAKINHLAPKNGIIIGGDLYELTKKISEYDFDKLKGISILKKKTYPTYSVRRNER